MRAVYGDVTLEVSEVTLNKAPSQDTSLVVASTEVGFPDIGDDGIVSVDEGARSRMESYIALLADFQAVATRSARHISSPEPTVAFAELAPQERARLEASKGFAARMPTQHRIFESIALDDPVLLDLASDRRDGILLMAEAVSSSHPTGRFHEFIRLFERAFGRSSTQLVDPLAEFLKGVPSFAYDRSDVNLWLTVLRHSSIHADRRKQLATALDIQKVLWRVEQAAYDVLFNKAEWRSISAERRSIMTWHAGVGRGDSFFITQGHTPKSTFQLMDPFGIFPKALFSIESREGWWARIAAPSRKC